ncbi:MAG: hypothetical protein PHS14_02260 [Elusimicrobia bacterium]|nr:hypothetical protein [Elusimicrobiota bacterium]
MLSARFRRIIGVASLAVFAGLAAFPALAQFGAPYDPDFAPAAEKKAEPAKPAPTEEAPLEPVPGAPAAPFQLLDRPEGAGFLTPAPAVSTAPAPVPRDPGEVRAGMTPVQYDASRFERVREQVDRGEEPGTERGPGGGLLMAGEEVLLSTAAPKPPPPEVELPTYGTSLSVTGRKVIGFNFSEKRFLNSQKTTGRAQTTNLIEIDQQLQLRMQGKVGPKITVNVDYDDTKLNQQDISIVYQGDPNEVVQNVSFGDIDLSLPATEFVSYNKQLFGIRADIKYKGFRSTFIGSRTKGTTKTKQFTGNTQFVATDLQDISYLRRQYYDVTFDNPARLPVRAGSERVYLAKQEIGVTNLNEQDLIADDIVCAGGAPCVNTSTFSGKFLPLVAGQDYTIDYAKGIIQFRNQLLPQYAVAIDYIDNAGNELTFQSSSNTLAAAGSGRFKLIKTPSDIPIISTATEAGYNREMKTFYSIGQNQIVRDNGRGNFIMRVLDLNRVEVGSGLLPVQKYPDTIDVDFENGIVRLKQPFSVTNASPTTPDPDVYAQTPIAKRIIRVEYSYRFKTFFLEPNLVVQSEIVILDGQKLTRNVDYFIDYEAGFITFFNPDRITTGSTIDMSFEVAPFANLNNDTLLGGRVSQEWGGGKYSVGTTLLYQAGSKSPTVPQITELAKSLLVYEFDAQAKRIKIGDKLIVTLAGEFAQSRQNLNLNQFALIDNMEGIKQEDLAPTLAAQWQIASNPSAVPAAPNKLNWISEDVNVLAINPRAQASASESQKVLQFQYGAGGASPLANGDEVSIVFPFSVSGVDMSQKTILEVVMLGDGSGNDLNFRLGGIDENADGSGLLITGNSATSRTEDINNDGILQPGEDIGFLYSDGVNPPVRYGAGNGIIDSFDLNKNGRLDPDDFNGADFGYFCTGGSNCTSATGNTLHDVTVPAERTSIDFAGPTWHTFQIPLNISTATFSRFTNIKNLRVTIRKAAAGTASGTIKFARIAVVGNTWQRGAAGDPSVPAAVALGTEKLTVTPVNSVDNPTYTPIFNAAGDASTVFNDLYGSLSTLQKQSNSKNLSEQALQLEYANLAAGTTVYTKRLFSRAVDVSQHRYFNFLVYGNAAGADTTGDHVFFLRAGADQDYFEVQVPITFNGWKKVRVEQTSRSNNSVMDGWKSATPGTVVVSSGNPSLQQVSELVAGVYSKTNANQAGAVFLNEIHLAEPVTRVGTANKIQADFELAGWGALGLKHRAIDRNFQTPTSVVANQDNTEDASYLSLTRLAWFPMSFSINRHITDTPSTVQTGNLSNLVNLLQQGKVTTWAGSAQGNLAYGAYPRLSLSHTRNRVEYELLTRLDDRQTYNGTLQYGVPSQSRFLPRTIDANAGHIRYDVTFDDPIVKRGVGNFDTAERTNSYGLRMTFTPWTGSSFNPSWSTTKVTESRVDSTGAAPLSTRYPKSFAQSAGFSSNYRLTSWLNPQVNYQIDTREDNILSVSTFVLTGSTYVFAPGDIKTVNRSANASISLPIQISDIFPRTKLFHSVNIISGYQLQDGDVWNQVEKDLSTQKALWIRTPLRPSNPVAQRANLTLRDTYNSTQRWSPLDGYSLTGRSAAWRSLSLSNNYVLSVQRNEVTGTPSKTIQRTLPDAVVSIAQLEQLWHSERWMANTQMDFKYSIRTTENVGSTLNTEDAFATSLRTIVIKRYETLISYNNRASKNKDLRIDANTQSTKHEDVTTQVTFDIRKFRITPKVDYAKDITKLGTGVKTQDVEVITPSVLVRADLAMPAGLRLPGSAKPLLFTNRIIWTTTASLAQRRSPVTVADNSKLFSLNTSGDYEIAKNLRMTLNGSAQRLWHKFLKEEDFIAYAFGTTLTFQF